MKNLKTNFSILALLLFATSFMSCTRAEPNYEAVLMTNYGKNGKADFATVTGTVYTIWFGTELYQVPMYEQKGNPERMEIATADGGGYTIDPSYTYSANRESGVDIIFSYKHTGLSGMLGDDAMNKIEIQVLNPLVLNAYREEARNYTSDSLLTHINNFENIVEKRLKIEFKNKYFNVNSLTSGLTPPASMKARIEQMNNAKIETQTVKNQLATATMLQQKAIIDAKTNEIKSQGFTKEVLAQQWIEAVRNSQNRIIITDGKTPVFFNGQ